MIQQNFDAKVLPSGGCVMEEFQKEHEVVMY